MGKWNMGALPRKEVLGVRKEAKSTAFYFFSGKRRQYNFGEEVCSPVHLHCQGLLIKGLYMRSKLGY
jgi:hypothetical protein